MMHGAIDIRLYQLLRWMAECAYVDLYCCLVSWKLIKVVQKIHFFRGGLITQARDRKVSYFVFTSPEYIYKKRSVIKLCILRLNKA